MSEEKNIQHSFYQADEWHSLKAFTQARIALGRTGTSIPLKESLQFKLAHAYARDAVFAKLNAKKFEDTFNGWHLPYYLLHSKATDRNIFLQRPDLGRRLNEASVQQLISSYHNNQISIVIADGLSATAINQHALPVLKLLLDKLNTDNFSVAPICIAEQARVAIADEIAFLLNAQLSVILIGERPGLTAADSLGAYLTYAPKIGLTDESRNCISNIRPNGLHYKFAVEKIFYLITEAFRLRISGVGLKDYTGLI